MHIIYKTTNLVNNKIYIGYHKTNLIDDPYIGSGKILVKAIEKYGKENFKKEILFTYDNKKDAFNKEKELVNEKFVNDKNTYNIKIGGEGGWDYINNLDFNHPTKINIRKNISKGIIKAHKEGRLKGWSKNKTHPNGMKGKHHCCRGKNLSDEHKKKISENNGNRLSEDEINSRLEDIKNTPRDKNFRKVLMKKWNVSPQQVGRFLKRHNEC